MRRLINRNEELFFTAVAYGLLGVVLTSFLTVRFTKESYAKLREGPAVLALYPSSVIPGALQRVTVLSEKTHFGPRTTVHAEASGVLVSGIRFASDREMSFGVYLHDAPFRREGREIPLAIRSPVDGGAVEEVRIALSVTLEADPLELDLFNFEGQNLVTTENDYILFGYRPRGYAPFRFTARNMETGRVFNQETRREIEHLGVRLSSADTAFELRLSDTLGREVQNDVFVRSTAVEPSPSDFTSLWSRKVAYAQSGGYSGKPTQWGSNPTEQVAATECGLGNGPLSCGGGCSGNNIKPPPNDYVTTLGEAEREGVTVLLHNGQFREDVVDFYVPGRGLDFVWKRSYQSGINLDGFLGKNWDFNWGAHFIVEYSSGTIPIRGRFSRGDCRRDLYDNASLQGYEYVFTTLPTGYFDIKTSIPTTGSEVNQLKRNGFKQIFDQATGNLKSRQDRYGNTQTVIYSAQGKISRVQDTLGRYIDFYYYTSGVGNGRLSKMTDFAGRSVTYEFMEAYVGGPVVLSKVLYPATTWIDDTTDPWTTMSNTSRTVSYTYESTSPGRLVGVYNGRGKLRASNAYDANGRVSKQHNFSGSNVYHDFAWTLASGKVSSVIYKNRAGNQRRYDLDTSNHLSTRRDVTYVSEGTTKTATTWLTRGCSCTLPSAIQEPDNGYHTFSFTSSGDVSLKRSYADNTSPYSETAGADIVHKAYFAPINSTAFGVVTRIVGPKGFATGASESTYATDITYDYSGNPVTITSPTTSAPYTQDNHKEIRTYNSYGQLLTVKKLLVTSPESAILTTLTYYGAGDTPADNLGYLKDVKVKYDATNEFTTTYTYRNFGANTKVRDGMGWETTYVVDNEFLVTEETKPSPLSYVKKFSHNGDRQIIKTEVEIDPPVTGNDWWETRYLVNDGGVVTLAKREISESGGSITWKDTSYALDNEFRTTMVTDGEGNKTLFLLDERGLAVRATMAYATPTPSPDESIVQQVFNDEEKLLTRTIAFRNAGDSSDTNLVSRLAYDVFDRPEYVFDGADDGTPDNSKRSYYDLASMETKTEEFAAGNATPLRRTERAFDEMDRLHQVTRGVATNFDVTVYTHDRANRVTSIRDDNSEITRLDYDLAGRLTRRTHPTFNGLGSGENYETYSYDLSGNLTGRVSHEVETVSPYSSADFEWVMAYDRLNRRTTTTFKGSDGATGPNPVDTINTYDARDLVISKTDVDGIPTKHEYDGLGRLVKTIYNNGGSNPSQIEVEIGYDKANNATSRTDADDNVTTYTFDDQNRLAKTTHADGDWIELKYNKIGQVMSKAYGNGGAELKKIKYRYDLRGLLEKKQVSWTTEPSWSGWGDYSTSEETFAFDGAYRLTNANDDDAKVTFAYNALDQVTSEAIDINLKSGGSNNWKGNKTTTSTWDDTGKRRTSVTYPISGKKFENNHDSLNRITEIRLDGSPDKPMARYWYEGPGSDVLKRDRGLDLSAGTPNTFRSQFTDDALQRNIKIEHQRDTGSTTNLRILDYTWGNGSQGRIYQRSTYYISDASSYLKKDDLFYDNVGRISLDKWVHLSPQEDYKYTHTPTQYYSKREKTVNSTTTTEREFTRATDGSLQMTAFTNPSTSCTFDTCGNMVTQGSISYYYDHENRLVFIDGATDFRFRYDALGRRVVEKEGSTETLFYYDGLHIVEETNSSVSVIRWSLFGVALDEVLYTWGPDNGGTNKDHWPLTDHVGSVVQVVGNDAANLATFSYSTAYGAAAVSGGSSKYPYGFTGRRRILADNELYDYRARTYEPGCGRFLQRDSIGLWGDTSNMGNGYAYVGGDPANSNDPLGLIGPVDPDPIEYKWVECEKTGIYLETVEVTLPLTVNGEGGLTVTIMKCYCSYSCSCAELEPRGDWSPADLAAPVVIRELQEWDLCNDKEKECPSEYIRCRRVKPTPNLPPGLALVAIGATAAMFASEIGALAAGVIAVARGVLNELLGILKFGVGPGAAMLPQQQWGLDTDPWGPISTAPTQSG